MFNRNLTKQSTGERFWLDRRRLSRTQAQEAKRLDVSERRYNHIENDKVEYEFVPPLATTELGALCALARRRDGRSLRRLATMLKAGSHVTLLAWEESGDPRLVKAWKAKGYRFYPRK